MGKPPLDTSIFPRTHHWHTLLQALIAELMPDAPEHVQPVLENLSKTSDSELEIMAKDLFAGNYGVSVAIKPPSSGPRCLYIGRKWQPKFRAKPKPNMVNIANSARYAAACQ